MMHKISELVLMSGLDIELDKPSVKIRQPKIKEIALIGEDKFFSSMSIFYIKPEPLMDFINLSEEEKKIWIDSSTAYDNLLFLIQAIALGPGEEKEKLIESIRMAFKILVSTHTFHFNSERGIMLLNADDKSHSIVVDRDLFLKFKSIAEDIFLLKKFFGESDQSKKLSPAAQKIADKMALSEKKIKELKNDKNSGDNSQFARILSIMGMKHELDYLSNLTVYQLYNQFERFNLLLSYEQSVQATLAGASNVEIVDWYKKI